MPRKPTPFNVAVGKRLGRLRKALGFDTLRAFAEAIGVDEDRYRLWERGDNGLPPEVALILFNRYEATHDYFYRGDLGGLPGRLIEKLKKAA